MAIAAPPVRKSKPLTPIAYVIGGLSFIPLLGIPFALAAIIWGLVAKSRLLSIFGVAGLLFTVVLYGSLIYFGLHQRGGVYDRLRSQMAVMELNETVKRIEYYRLQNGHYPARLKDIVTKGSTEFPAIQDPTGIERNDVSAEFFYKLDPSEKFYYLRSVGPDGIPFTSDDVVPTISESERVKTGLKIQQ